jgi:hypothetical protein
MGSTIQTDELETRGQLMKDYEKIIAEIIEALELPSEEYSDGECMDVVAEILQGYGYTVFGNTGGN